MRSTREVIEHHLECRQADDLERDIRESYSNDVLLLSYEGVHRGHAGVRKLADILASYVPAGTYRYEQVICEDDVGMLRWTAESGGVEVQLGVDSYIVREGLIVAQTIYYTTQLD